MRSIGRLVFLNRIANPYVVNYVICCLNVHTEPYCQRRQDNHAETGFSLKRINSFLSATRKLSCRCCVAVNNVGRISKFF
jgi:hypothetical protein